MAFRRRPPADPVAVPVHDDDPPGTPQWLQAWFALQCDDDWEHGQGIRVETLDNPGWHVRIALTGTALADRDLPQERLDRSEHDWYVLRREGEELNACCGPLDLGEVLHLVRRWVEQGPATAG